MTYPRLPSRFMLAICLCCTPGISEFARGQSAPAETPSRQGISAPNNNIKHEEQKPLGRSWAFLDFIRTVGIEDRAIKEQIREGKEPPPDQMFYIRMMHLREDEEREVHTILVDAYYKLEDNRKQHLAKSYEIGRENSGSNTKLEALQDANRADEGRTGDQIVQEAIFRIFQALGEEDFKKVDAYVYRKGGGGTVVGSTRPPVPYTYPGPPEPPTVQP